MTRGPKPVHAHCTYKECTKAHYAKGYCESHYSKNHKYGSPEGRAPKYCHCGEKAVARNLCKKHYSSWWYHNNEPTGVNPDHYNFKEEVNYQTAHYRVRRTFGKATLYPCIDCGKQAAEWSLMHGVGDIFYGESSCGRADNAKYSPNPYNYQPRCDSCHIKYDAEDRKHTYGRKVPTNNSEELTA